MNRNVWVGNGKDDVKAFPADARRDAGFQLSRVQHSEEPDDWKPMSAIGAGIREARIREPSGAFRIVYVARFADAIYVLHAFQKRRSGRAQGISNWLRNASDRYRGKP
jgi:phage-related protein